MLKVPDYRKAHGLNILAYSSLLCTDFEVHRAVHLVGIRMLTVLKIDTICSHVQEPPQASTVAMTTELMTVLNGWTTSLCNFTVSISTIRKEIENV